MDLPTYTRIWRIEKRLYKLYDFRLPVPVSLVTIGVFVGTSVVWWLLMGVLGVPFSTPWHVVWIVPPGVITFLATRPVIEGKSLTELLRSQIVYATEARVYTRLAPQYEPERITVSARVWRRAPEAGPLPGVTTAVPRQEPYAVTAESATVEELLAPAGTATPEVVEEAVEEAAEEAVETAATADAPALEPARPRSPGDESRRVTETQRAPRTPLTRRVLNYFGFALDPSVTETASPSRPPLSEPGTSADRRRRLAPSRSQDDAPSPLLLPGRDMGDSAAESYEDEDWYASLGVASGHTPWPAPDRAADETDDAPEPEDEAAKAEAERRAAEERAATRRRAEEIMAAPEPEPTPLTAASRTRTSPEQEEHASSADVPTQPSPAEDLLDIAAEKAHRRAGRQLRGRAQSRMIARRMERDRAAETAPADSPSDAAERPGTEPTAYDRGAARPAAPEETRRERRTPGPRPHAAPWDLPPVARTSDTGVPEIPSKAAPSPWDETDDEEAPQETAATAASADAAPAGDTTDTPEREEAAPESARAAEEPETWAADLSSATDLPSLAEQIRATAAAKPRLEIDHG
ncbi:conjugal transfer protein, partial [Thermobifida cellulosilytica]